MKRPGQCDFGDCQKPAEVLLIHQAETRPMCSHHADFSQQLMPGFKYEKAPLHGGRDGP